MNNVHAFGEVDGGLFSACCQNGLETVQGTLGGIIAADLATGHQSRLLREFLQLNAPNKLPPRPIATMVPAHAFFGVKKTGAEL